VRSTLLLIAFLPVLLAGCASTSNAPPHVFSGEAPVDAVIARADGAAVAGDFTAAALLYQQALSQEPSGKAWYRLGMAETYLGNPDRAMWSFLQALELEPEHPESLQRVALYYTANERAAEARAYLDRLLAVDERNWRAHNALGVLADLEQRFDEAADHYAAAIERQPGSALLWNNLGYSRYLAADYELAQNYFEHALQVDPDFGTARHNLALLYARQSQYEQALSLMLAGGDQVVAYSDVGYFAFKLGDLTRAEALLNEAIRRSPTYNLQASQNLAAVREAMQAEADSG
jgi:Flp pilus assembly protein TadD